MLFRSVFLDALRPDEKAKIECGEKHFESLDSGIEFCVANSFESFEDNF